MNALPANHDLQDTDRFRRPTSRAEPPVSALTQLTEAAEHLPARVPQCDLAVTRHRIVDNAGYFPAGRDPRTVGDDLLYDRLLQEFPSWLSSARTAQVLQ
ncbi:VWA domain-containing protein [Streptomyces aureus]|uniref:VWA domain-containing protein n=1 Tax=Streptomyces aureus TaxID=193461 RepID=UPI00337E8940